ncbi:hypothetical protein H4F99_06285 [Lysobacter sp. SG-8]|uniref:DUF5916 domain-containing protein n=1 Tax=Marilutibacter penaei TaxID=2759900 RepID=A0A7W3YEA2_9GAMM|nr:DUF5916 domain-containing protein [Lysobacter penaei]MBB1088095.1 hypothetical protein [Lysobacter penaei]
MRLRSLLLLSALWAGPTGAVEIDGRVGADEWREARHVQAFVQTQPLTQAPATLPTEAWVMATPEGLAVAFRNVQPRDVEWTRQKVQRDFSEQVDRVNLMVDFDGDGRTGYNFTVASTGGVADAVITNEREFNDDWDGRWSHAVHEEGDAWTVEMLIPWYIAPMRSGSDGTRRITLQLDRVVGSTGERVAWPGASFERPRYLSDFAPIDIPVYSQSLLAITPYVSGLHDLVGNASDLEGGVDLFWKPNGQFQLTATLNPDFGQVESDDLVINFSATETFVSDKRPFFTENQGIFGFTTPSDYSQLLYTRRVGGPADDGDGAGDIDAAVKLNGSFGAAKYGVFLADESGDAGRTFGALRLVRDFDNQNLGAMLTRVERPFLDREATVLGVDHNWRPTERVSVESRLIGSDIDMAGEESRDSGATVFVNFEMDDAWRQQWLAMHFGDALQLNDFGYLSRNDLNYAHWQVQRRFADQPAGSRFQSTDWRARISGTDNDHGLRLQRQFRLSREGRLRDGSFEYAQVNINGGGFEDRLTRGNGALAVPGNFNAYYEYDRPRQGNWAWEMSAEAFSGGLEGNDAVGVAAEFEPTYFFSDALSASVGIEYLQRPDWLVWQRDNLIGSFEQRSAGLSAGLEWLVDERQELRVKLQAIGLDADLRQAYRVAANGQAVASSDPVDDFSVRTLGFQVRYRYELAPLSYLYIVYGRGGYEGQPFSEAPFDLVEDSFRLRDDEQLLVKLSYRFEI